MEELTMGARILRRRKGKGMTQEALAGILGVSNQAVSKWESEVCCPDIQLLPQLADTLDMTLDELFGREKAAEDGGADVQVLPVGAELPWEDDDSVHAVLFQGHRLLVPKQGSLFRRDKYDEVRKVVELHFSGTAQDIYSDFSVVCTDTTVKGGIRAGDSITCGNVGGSVSAGDGVKCGSVGGDVQAGDGAQCGDVGGSVRAGDSITCGNVGGNVQASDSVRIGGNVEGSVHASDSVTCGNVGGDVSADSVRCKAVGGSVNQK